ncbi:chromosome segregation protein SMC [Jannaschia seosinensis]|uniref:Chromosome segregation protein SMC n=1 Tax=Jannaschia seosinensis TaxID=313367 RepID=A0A0M7BFC6_9RHOB|nr:hypothetical protein [Jannaschia seosinensis]CUH40026.1 chromosome segregation protein SMC [Jannaschia seosinensis]
MGKDRGTWVTIGLVGALVLAAIVIIWLAVDRTSMQQDYTTRLETEETERLQVAEALAALEASSGELETVRMRIAETDASLAELATQRSEMQSAFDTELADLTSRREVALSETEAAESERDRLVAIVAEESTALEDIRAEADRLEQTLSERTERLTQTETRLTEQLDELAAVGSRLQEARAQEAQLRETLAEMQGEAAGMAQELADAETRTQEARSAETDLQQLLQDARDERAALEETQSELESEIADLTARRDTLETDTAAAQEQRAQVQTELTQLTQLLSQRGDELAQIEQRITATLEEAQDEGAAEGEQLLSEQTDEAADETDTSLGTLEAAEDAPIVGAQSVSVAPGTYESGEISATFAEDGTFRMENTASDENVSGQFVEEAGLLILSEPEGDLSGNVSFPLTCMLENRTDGFALTAPEVDGDCGPLAGTTFTAAD